MKIVTASQLPLLAALLCYPGRAPAQKPTAVDCHTDRSAPNAAHTGKIPVPNCQLRTRVLMLGTGNPVPGERAGPATVILVDSTAYLIDAGSGAMRRWAAELDNHAVRGGIAALRTLFITHLHSDHTFDYPELILTPWTLTRTQAPAMHVYGPPGLQNMTDHILAAYAEDIAIRTGAGGESEGGAPPDVQVHEVMPGIVYRDSLVTVTAFPAAHGTWTHAYGYRFDTPDRTIVISGDASAGSAVAEQCNRCDLLIHEGGRPSDISRPYYKRFHTTAEEIATIANQSQPKLLVLYHQRDRNPRGLEIIQSQYNGKVIIAEDGDVF